MAPKFSRRHYVAVAEVLNDAFTLYNYDRSEAPAVLYILTDRMGLMFAEDNPRFDLGRFCEAVYKRDKTPVFEVE